MSSEQELTDEQLHRYLDNFKRALARLPSPIVLKRDIYLKEMYEHDLERLSKEAQRRKRIQNRKDS